MNTGDLTRMVIRIPFSTARAFIIACEKRFLLPRHAIALGAGEHPGEAVIFDVPYADRQYSQRYRTLADLQKREPSSRKVKEQQRVYLSILSQILKAMPDKFAEVAPTLRGTRRAYFGRTREEVEETGKSNKALRIPDTETEWWAGVDNAGDRKQQVLARLMRKLGGFSEDYIDIISWAPCTRYPDLRTVRFESV